MFGALAGLLVALAPAPAGDPRIDLVWRAPAACPDAAGVHRRLRALAPALPPGPVVRAVADVYPRGAGWRLQLALHGPELDDRRILEARDCHALADVTALLIALAVAPEVVAARVTPGPADGTGPGEPGASSPGTPPATPGPALAPGALPSAAPGAPAGSTGAPPPSPTTPDSPATPRDGSTGALPPGTAASPSSTAAPTGASARAPAAPGPSAGDFAPPPTAPAASPLAPGGDFAPPAAGSTPSSRPPGVSELDPDASSGGRPADPLDPALPRPDGPTDGRTAPAPAALIEQNSARGRRRGAVRLAGGGEVGAIPAWSPAVGLAFALLGDAWRVELAGTYAARALAYPDRDGVGGRIRLAGGGLRGCYVPRRGRLEFPICGGLELGLVRAVGRGVTDPRPARDLWVAVQLSPGLAWAPSRFLALTLGVDILIALRRPGFHVASLSELARGEPVGLRPMLGFEARFP